MTGEAVGDATGDGAGVAVATGTGLFGTLALESQAPKTAVETANIVANINDLLMVISPLALPYGRATDLLTDPNRPLADIRSQNERERFFHGSP